MKSLIHYEGCPICSAASFRHILTAKDHTVSGESFAIMECPECGLRFTQDVPDAASIGPYYQSDDYISHSNTSRGLINRLYHYVRNTTLVRKRKLLQAATGKKTGRMLDLGSGTGAFVSEMKKNGWDAVGLEPDVNARSVGKSEFGIDLLDMDHFNTLEPGFDAITMWHVLEHVHDLHPYVTHLRNLLSENGRLLIAVPNYTSADAAAYQADWAAYDVPRHLYHFSPRSMKALMDRNGLQILSYKPMWYDSFYISLLSSKLRNGKTNWLGAGFTGLRSNAAALVDTKKCSSVIYVIGRR